MFKAKSLILKLCIVFSLISGASFAQAIDKKFLPPELEQQDGKNKIMDFAIPLKGISDPGMKFQHFAKKPLLVFYFSAKCPHCMQTYPEIQAIADAYEKQGLTTIAIATGHNAKSDIRTFISNQKAKDNVPFLKDAQNEYSKQYGTGKVPLIMFVNEDGSFYRFTNYGYQKQFLKKILEEKFNAAPAKK